MAEDLLELQRRGQAERAAGKLDAAEQLLLQGVAAAETLPPGPELPAFLNDLGMTYKYAARFDEAESVYRRALDLRPAGR